MGLSRRQKEGISKGWRYKDDGWFAREYGVSERAVYRFRVKNGYLSEWEKRIGEGPGEGS